MSLVTSVLRGSLVASALLFTAAPAAAGVGDLLVAPTRIVLNGSRGTEVILNNIGDDVATYRISLEMRRMKSDGSFEEVTAPSEAEKQAEAMILYAPRRITLPPNQPQSIRVSARAPAGLPDGEYRVHLLFRAVPPPQPAVKAPADFKGIGFQLTPVYGVTIPVIVRLGNLQAKAAISNVHLARDGGKPAIALDLARSGSRSTYGEVRVYRAGSSDLVGLQRGVAVYTELQRRSLSIPLDETKGAVGGPVTVQYFETGDGPPLLVAEARTVLR
ncbi:molecular chaperone [Sphingomonas ginkgonis]|uniref:Molecular chaperone n=1 Tax=Sphingomonas ginkgonis TaxID=2315330 RepID=A0A3R9YKE0_9SPHN|nr:molecular chaperone [Sphingomonas ginkgonis]RST29773.1 molecular chaperone [Sphingomonas ginkgonis]